MIKDKYLVIWSSNSKYSKNMQKDSQLEQST